MISFFKLVIVLFIFFFLALGWIAYSFYRQVSKNAKRFNRYNSHERKTPKGDTIIDNRSDEERTRQVIKDDEGEYVDFTEANSSSEENK